MTCINTEKDYMIADYFDISVDEVDLIPLKVVEYLRTKIYKLATKRSEVNNA